MFFSTCLVAPRGDIRRGRGLGLLTAWRLASLPAALSGTHITYHYPVQILGKGMCEAVSQVRGGGGYGGDILSSKIFLSQNSFQVIAIDKFVFGRYRHARILPRFFTFFFIWQVVTLSSKIIRKKGKGRGLPPEISKCVPTCSSPLRFTHKHIIFQFIIFFL